jgi:hypothetical protein
MTSEARMDRRRWILALVSSIDSTDRATVLVSVVEVMFCVVAATGASLDHTSSAIEEPHSISDISFGLDRLLMVVMLR